MTNSEKQHYTVRISPIANDSMYKHYEFLARVSEPAAKRLLHVLLEDIRSLEYSPYRFAPYEHSSLKKEKYRYLISAKRYRIVYQIMDDAVLIDDIQDCR